MHSDTVLPRLNLIGLGLVMLATFGVIFALGYRLGRSQKSPEDYRATNKESGHPETGSDVADSATPSAKPQSQAKSDEVANPQESSEAAPSAVADTPSNAAAAPRGTILLQVAAVTNEGDATALAKLLQQKSFPAFVRPPRDDHYYRVQLGPYQDHQSADVVMSKLEAVGFKAIIKR